MVWLNPYFLWALLFLAIPIIIHLFNFRRYKPIYFTNVRFLKQFTNESKTGNQLKKWLILTCRCLALAFLVFAFAYPIIPKNKVFNANKKIVVIIADNSYSMTNQNKEGLMLESVKNRARAIVNAHRDNDEFLLLTTNLNHSILNKTSKINILEMIDRIEVGNGTKAFENLLETSHRILNQYSEEKKIYIISDFPKEYEIKKIPFKDSSFQINLVQIPNSPLKNIALDSCWLNSPILMSDKPVEILVKVRNFNNEDAENVNINLLINGKPKGVASVSVKSNSEIVVSFKFTPEKGEIQSGKLELSKDEIPYDDELFFTFHTKNNFKVIAIENQTSKYFSALFKDNEGFQFSSFSASNIQYQQFADADLIILNNINELGSGIISELKKTLENGTTILTFPNSTVAHGGFNNLNQLGGINYSEKIETLAVSVSSFEQQHIIFNDIFEKIKSNIVLPDVNQYFTIQSPSGISCMKLSNGASFMTEQKVSKGRIFSFCSPLDVNFSNFPIHSFFVPILLKSAMISSVQSQLYFETSNTNEIPTNLKFESNNQIKVKQNNFQLIPEMINKDGRLWINTNGELNKSGNYEIISNNSQVLKGVSFNHNRKESQIETFDESELIKISESLKLVVNSGNINQLEQEIK